MMYRISTLSFLFILRFTVFAQYQANLSSSQVLLKLQKLNALGRVLYIAAHPDDENTRLLAYLANERKCRTAYLSLTRGDGGQNLIGKEQGDALGVIRTQELLAARRVDGAEQYFSQAADFGYSKNPEETFAHWDKENTLRDVVYLIRKFRPDVIISRFPTSGEGGHGHHTASAILAQEAFEAAADPKRFPEQLTQVKVWSCKRLFWNTFNFSSNNTTAPDQLQVDVGGFNPLLGKSYGEIASESRSCHKSQGFGVPRQRGKNTEYFKLLKGDSVKKDLLEGITLSWSELPGAEKLQKEINKCIRNFKAEHPESSVPDLLMISQLLEHKKGDDSELQYWKEVKSAELQEILLACSGLWLEASLADHRLVPGQEITISSQIIVRSKVPVILKSMSFLQSDSLCNLSMQENNLYSFRRKEKIPESIAYSGPYWLSSAKDAVSFEGLPEKPAQLVFKFVMNIQGRDFLIQRPLIHKVTDPVEGEVYRPVELLPPATISCREQAFVFVKGAPQIVRLTIKANIPGIVGQVKLNSSPGWNARLNYSDFTLEKEGDELLLEATVDCEPAATEGTLSAQVLIGEKSYDLSIQRMDYDHIPSQFILKESSFKLVNLQINLKPLKVACIEGAGDDIPTAIRQLGFELQRIQAADLPKADLSHYDAVITGIRAYNTEKTLLQHNTVLLNYVMQGGNLLVQYNTNNNIGQLKNRIGPYPFTISRERITDENSSVIFNLPKHPALNQPNQLDSLDFTGWVQERGIYFATEIDSTYSTPLVLQDPGEKGKPGALIIAPYGKGNYVYTGLSFFRQLPAGVPGAYRLFVNLLHLPKH